MLLLSSPTAPCAHALQSRLSTNVSTPAQGFKSNNDYVRADSHSYFVNIVPHEGTEIYGVVTVAEDMPSTGSAVFNGEAQARYFNTTRNFDLGERPSEVTANFADGTVDVEMDSFTIANRETKVTKNVDFNSVNFSRIRVFGNQFSGGKIMAEHNGAEVAIIENDTQQSTIGRFFGLTNDGVPDEVGGIGYLKGDDGTLTTIFYCRLIAVFGLFTKAPPHDRLLRMKPVLGLIKDHRIRPIHDSARCFFLTVCRQAMHEQRVRFGV